MPLTPRDPVRLPPLQTLRAFVAAVRTRNFAQAGRELSLTHGAVSHHVTQLEAMLGATLFTRGGRGAEPTPEAVACAERLARALRDADEALQALKPRPAGSSVTLTLTPALAQRWLLPRLARLTAACPGIDLRLLPHADTIDLAAQEVDLALRFGGDRWAAHGLPLGREHLVPMAHPTLFGNRPAPTAEEIARATPLIRNPRQPWRPWFLAAGLDLPEPTTGLTLDDAGLALDHAAAGHGVVLGRLRLARSDLDGGRLVALSGIVIEDDFSYWLLHRPDRPPSPNARRVADWLREEMARTA